MCYMTTKKPPHKIVKNALDHFSKPKKTSKNCLLCLTKSPMSEKIPFPIKQDREKALNPHI